MAFDLNNPPEDEESGPRLLHGGELLDLNVAPVAEAGAAVHADDLNVAPGAEVGPAIAEGGPAMAAQGGPDQHHENTSQSDNHGFTHVFTVI